MWNRAQGYLSLTNCREPAPTVPTLLDLSRKVEDYSKFLERARGRNDLLQFVVGLVDRAEADPAEGDGEVSAHTGR